MFLKKFKITSFCMTATKEERNERYSELLTSEELIDFLWLKKKGKKISVNEFLRILGYMDKAGIIEVSFF